MIKGNAEMIMRYIVILGVLAGCAQLPEGYPSVDKSKTTYQSNEEYFEN